MERKKGSGNPGTGEPLPEVVSKPTLIPDEELHLDQLATIWLRVPRFWGNQAIRLGAGGITKASATQDQ